MLTAIEKQNITEGFEAAGERMKAFEAYQEELKAAIDQLADQFKQTGKAFLSGITSGGQEYRSFLAKRRNGETVWRNYIAGGWPQRKGNGRRN